MAKIDYPTQRQRSAKRKRDERRDRKKIADERPMCAKCGRPAVDIDHKKNRKMGGTWNPEILGIQNMQPLCRKCHEAKGGKSE
jgi:5-methylcytosine-specific restriction endonuclease McrA